MSKNPKVVSFERSPAYVHHRAMMNRRDNNLVDALELMRRAVEGSPENSEYKLDLAELYCEIGCHEQSSRLLLDMLSEQDPPSECYYGLALNQLGMNDLSGAMGSLNRYRDRDPNGARREEVEQLSAEIDYYNDFSHPASRRVFRAKRIAERACEAFKAEDIARACRLFERALALDPEQTDMRALFAMALAMRGDADGARRQMEGISMEFPPPVKALSVCAQAHALLGDKEKAERCIESAEQEHPQGNDLRLMIHAMGDMRMDERVAENARLALQEAPCERTLLHMRAVALKRTGTPDGEVAPFWERILRIDPDDSVAEFYADAAHRGALDEYTLSYAYEVPPEEKGKRLIELVNLMSSGFEAIRETWADNARFRRLVRWAIGADEARMGRVAVTVLATVRDAEAMSLMRQLLFSPEVAPEIKMHAALVLKLQGHAPEEVLPAGWSMTEGLMPDVGPMLMQMPVADRQLIRFAGEVVRDKYGRDAMPALALMWSGYRRGRGIQSDPVTDLNAAAAALAYNYLLVYGPKPKSLRAMARDFGCEGRRMIYYARRIAGVLEKMGENTQDEDL